MPTITALPYLFQEIMKINNARSGNMDSLSKVPDSVILEKQQQTVPFQFFLRVAEVFVPELTEVTFGRIAHAWKTEE